MEENALSTKKAPVLGAQARNSLLILAAAALAVTLALGLGAWKLPDYRSLLLTVLVCADVLLLSAAWLVPRFVYYGNYFYSLSGEGVTLWRGEESVMTLAWRDTEVSLGSYIRRGSENNPSVCKRAICFARRGAMRRPQRFPKRAFKGAAGEMCISYSKSRLRDVYQACGGNISADVTPDGLRLSVSDTEQMTDALEKTHEWARKRAESEAARAAADAERQAAAQAREAAREARESARAERQAEREAKAQAKAEAKAAREERRAAGEESSPLPHALASLFGEKPSENAAQPPAESAAAPGASNLFGFSSPSAPAEASPSQDGAPGAFAPSAPAEPPQSQDMADVPNGFDLSGSWATPDGSGDRPPEPEDEEFL